MALLASTPAGVTAQNNSDPAAWRGQSITEFDPAQSDELGWEIVNDGVMGGLSKGKVEITSEGTMRFSGNLSLKNNGGFSTVRSNDVRLNLSNDLGLLLRVRGDGRTYEARLASDARHRGMEVSFMGEFKTTKGEWTQVKVPFDSFKGSFRGMDLPDKVLDPSQIQRIGILLADKQEGPFELEVDWIRTYGKGQGDFVARETDAPAAAESAEAGTSSLIETAVADGRFKTLKAALDAAGLTTFFQWDNKLTVFAPTDEAFAKLPDGTLEDLLEPENKEKLVKILSYHVSAGDNRLADALKASEVETVQGSPLEIAFSDGRVRVNNASVIDADVGCSDGVIHVIDTVLLPPATKQKTVISTAAEAGSFKTLLAAVEAAGLTSVLEGEGPFTVFAPTDSAFAALEEGTVEELLKEENREKLTSILTYHVVAGRVAAGDALSAGTAPALEGSELKFGIVDGQLKVNESVIRTVDIDGGNGVIHVIDSVLLPPAAADRAEAEAGEKPMKKEDPADAIVAAIEKGVPLYNSGDAKACADVYRDCILELAENNHLEDHTRRALAKAVERIDQHSSASARAWFFRFTLDGMMAHLRRG